MEYAGRQGERRMRRDVVGVGMLPCWGYNADTQSEGIGRAVVLVLRFDEDRTERESGRATVKSIGGVTE